MLKIKKVWYQTGQNRPGNIAHSRWPYEGDGEAGDGGRGGGNMFLKNYKGV